MCRLDNALPLLVERRPDDPGPLWVLLQPCAPHRFRLRTRFTDSPFVFGVHIQLLPPPGDWVDWVFMRAETTPASPTPAPDYQRACGTLSRLVHQGQLTLHPGPLARRPFLESGRSLVASRYSNLVLPSTLRAVRGATPYVRTPFDDLRPCEPLTTSIHLSVPRLTPLSRDAGNGFAFL
jgi:hypothetical protein